MLRQARACVHQIQWPSRRKLPPPPQLEHSSHHHSRQLLQWTWSSSNIIPYPTRTVIKDMFVDVMARLSLHFSKFFMPDLPIFVHCSASNPFNCCSFLHFILLDFSFYSISMNVLYGVPGKISDSRFSLALFAIHRNSCQQVCWFSITVNSTF